MPEQLPQIIADKLADYAAKNWMDWVEEDGIYIGHWDKLGVLDSIIEETIIPTGVYTLPENFCFWFEMLVNHPIVKVALNEMESIATAAAKEQREWDQAQQSPEAMLRYYGMSIKDFI